MIARSVSMLVPAGTERASIKARKDVPFWWFGRALHAGGELSLSAHDVV